MEDQNQAKTNSESAGTSKFSWKIPEYHDYTRSRNWYIGAGIVAILLLVYSVWVANFLFGIIVIIAGVTIYYMDHNKPQVIEFDITTRGLLVGDKFFEYDEIANFFIIYEPPTVKNLFFEFKNVLKPRINIPLEDQDPVAIRKFLKKHLLENLERKGEPISETIGKMFKL